MMTPLPLAPSRKDVATFADRGDAMMAALPGFVTEANALEANVDAKEASAVAAAAAAYASETASVSAVNVTTWVSAGSYSAGVVKYSPINFQSYRAKTTHNSITTDPSLDATRWVQLSTVPSMTGHAGKVMGTDGTIASWGLPFTTVEYDDRNSIRALTPIALSAVMVKGLGMFVWTSGTAELDDDETCFATSTGRWTLQATAPEYVYGSLIAEISQVQNNLDTFATTIGPRSISSSFSMSLTTLAALVSSEFNVNVVGSTIGDHVVVTSGDLFGTTSADRAKLSYIAYVSSIDTVTISIRNSHATVAANMTASTWSILVIKQ